MVKSWWLRAAKALFALGSWTAAGIARHEALWVSAAAAACAFMQVCVSRRPLWFDELFTLYISRLPDVDRLFRALPADGNPPLYYLLARVSMARFGQTAVSVRLPSVLAFAGAALAVYYFVRRRRGPGSGLFAMLALDCCNIARYGSEARPYALLLGFVGLTLVSWQTAVEDKRPRRWPLMGVAVGIAGAIASHHYGSIHVGIPLACGEVVRLVKRRRLDIPMYCAGIAGLSMLFVTVPFAQATHRVLLNYVKQSASFWAKPTISSMGSYGEMVCFWLPSAVLVLLILTAVNTPASDSGETANKNPGLPAHEVAAAIGLTLLVPVMIGLTWFATGYYLERYAISAAMGIAILAGLEIGGSSHSTAVAALCSILLGMWLIAPLADAGARTIERRMARPPSANAATGWTLSDVPGLEPIVVASAVTYIPEWWYAPPQLRERLHYLADLTFAVRQPDFLPELSLVTEQPYVPSKVDDYRQFVSTHDHFLLYSVGVPRLEWISERLRSEGWSLRILRTRGSETLYFAEAPGR